jgi:hypothetical protein
VKNGRENQRNNIELNTEKNLLHEIEKAKEAIYILVAATSRKH